MFVFVIVYVDQLIAFEGSKGAGSACRIKHGLRGVEVVRVSH